MATTTNLCRDGLNCRSKPFAASFQKLGRPAADVVEILKQKGIAANIAKLPRLPRKKVD
jgi:hypothetical protein